VSSLLLLASLCTGEAPEAIADRIGDGGSGALKKALTEALNTALEPIRSRRAQLEKDPQVVADTLRGGIATANRVADATLREARAAMNMDYGL
jgi:tryptophanyl-tRNA synthetase